MTLSLNEVEATAKKATRGAGYPWGLAEEAGKATRWLCARDIDGCAVLAELLGLLEGADLSKWSPDTGEDPWVAEGGTLCPLVTGAAISDRAHRLRTDCIRIGKVADPAFLVPFAALAARQIKQTVTIAWPGTVTSTDGDNLVLHGAFPAHAAEAKLSMGGTVTNPNRRQSRARPNAETWKLLSEFAHRTYAPATKNPG